MKRFFKYTLIILGCLLLSVAAHSQDVITKKKVVVKDVLRFEGGNPDSLKIAVSMDGNGNFKWVYFTDFQDSINTGVYDSLIINYLLSNRIRTLRDSFTDPAATIASIGDSGFIVECFTCDTIQLLLDSTYNSPWTYNTGGNIVQRDTTLNVGVGTTSPTANLHVDGSVKLDSAGYSILIGQDLDVSNFVDGAAFYQKSAQYEFFVGNMYDDDNDEFHGVQKRDSTNGTVLGAIGYNTAGLGFIKNDLGLVIVSDSDSIGYIAIKHKFSGLMQIQDGTEADGYVLTSDASGNATWQDPTAYGEMGFGDSLRTIALTQNVWSVVTNSNNTLWQTAAIDTHNVQYSGDSLIIGKTGAYQLNAQLSVDGTANSVIRLGVYVNGSLACTCTGYQELVNNKIIQLTYINIDGLTAGDVVQVVIMNTANNDDVDAIGGKITINKIR